MQRPEPSPFATHGPSGLVLRRKREDDIGALRELLSQDEMAVLDPFATTEDITAFLTSAGSGSFETVATLDDQIVGFAGLYPLGGRQRHVGNFTLYVDGGFQGRGIGTVLMSTIVFSAQLMIGLHRLQLAVFTDNHRAISLYRRFGFTIEGRLARFAERPDGFADAFLMALVQPSL